MTTIALSTSTLFPVNSPAAHIRSLLPDHAMLSSGHAVTDTQTGIINSAEQELDDEGLIVAICQGAEWAMEKLYQRYARYAYALAYRVLRDSAAAEDIVQDAFLAIWRKATSYQKQQGSVRSWVQAIVHHRAVDKVRAATLRDYQCSPLQVEDELDPVSKEPEVWEQAWQHEQAEHIRSALAALPEEQRRVIELAYFAGYTHVQVAATLNIPLGTVKGRMRLGLQKMKHLLQERDLEVEML